MLETVIFYLLFISQIGLFSYYFPKQLHQRMQLVINAYPPEQYPKLYPKKVDEYHAFHRRYWRLNQMLMLAGILILSVIMILQVNVLNDDFALIPWAYFMVQFIPLFMLEFSEFNQIKQMREHDTRSKRTAQLSSKGVFDYLSMGEVIMTALFFIGAAGVALIVDNPDFPNKIEDVGAVFVLLGTNLFFFGMSYWTMRVRKFDPYQAPEDRDKIILTTLKSALYTSIGLSIFMAATVLLDANNMDYLMPSLISLYCQGIAFATLMMMLRNLDINKINFEVYRDSPEQNVAKSVQQ